jgi:hypothetical protein
VLFDDGSCHRAEGGFALATKAERADQFVQPGGVGGSKCAGIGVGPDEHRPDGCRLHRAGLPQQHFGNEDAERGRFRCSPRQGPAVFSEVP